MYMKGFMSVSIAQSRQQFSSLIAAAQVAPQIITKRNKAVAVLVSAEYFKRTQAAAAKTNSHFFSDLVQLRMVFEPLDDDGLAGAGQSRLKAWSRANPFAEADPGQAV